MIEYHSYKYNCHAYAWHVSEGGDKVWIGGYFVTTEDIYWADGSYTEVAENVATKVSYHQDGNHSAVRLNSTWYQSKWGNGPLVRHHPNDVPQIYQPSKVKKYYKRTPLTLTTDLTLLCYGFDANISVTNPPNGFTWGSSSNLQIVETGNNTVRVVATSGTSEDEGSLEWVNIKENGVEVARTEIWVGPPGVTGITGPDYVSSYGRYTAVYNPLSNPSFYWSIGSDWNSQTYNIYGYGNYADAYFYNSNSYYLELEACNSCGCIEGVGKSIYAYVHSSSPVSSYPNPVNDVLHLELNSQATTSLQRASAATYEIRLYNQYGIPLRSITITNGSKEQLNVSNLPDGTYFLHIYDGINPVPEKRQIVVKH